MKNIHLTEVGRLERNAYMRNYRKANRKKINEIAYRCRIKKAREFAAEEK